MNQFFDQYTLPCGLRVLHQKDDSPIIHSGYGIKVGSQHDPLRYYGLAHLVEHMLFKGTRLRNATQIIYRTEEIGADINAFTSKDDTFVHAVFPKAHTKRMVNVLTDIVFNSLIPEEELQKEKKVIIEEINSYEDSPSEMIFDEFEELLFRGTPVAHNILGREQSVMRITSAVAQQFMHRYYIPSNMVFCIRGNVEMASVLDLLNHQLSRYATSSPLSVVPEMYGGGLDKTRTFSINRRRETSQVHRIVGCLAPSLHDADRLPMTLLCNMLGGPAMSSRLNLLLRERYGLVYGVESSFTPMSSAGVFSIYFGCSKKDLPLATNLVHRAVDEYCVSLVSEDELRKAKRQLRGQLTLAMDNREGSFLAAAKNYLHYDRCQTIDETFQKIEEITPQEVCKVAYSFLLQEYRRTLTYL